MKRSFTELDRLRADKALKIISIIYLAHELAFNAHLCSLPLGQVSDLEYYGRTLAGLGAALMVARFLLAKVKPIPLAVILVVIFGLTFVGQRQIIESLVDRTTGQERYDAQHLALLSSLMIDGKATVAGLASSISANPAKMRAYALLLGLSTWNDPEQMKQIRRDRHQMALAQYGQEAFHKVDSAYQKYILASQEFNKLAIKIDKAAPQLATSLKQIAPRLHNAKDFQLFRKIWHKKFSEQADGQVVELDAFCREERRQTYFQGRQAEGMLIYDCMSSNDQISRVLKLRAKNQILAQFQMRALQNLPLEQPLSLEQWREKLKPFAEAEIHNRVSSTMATPASLQNGGKKEAEGKSAARSVIVPPVAIAFSLFFSIVNALGLIGGVLASKYGVWKAFIFQATSFAILIISPFFLGPPVIIGGMAGVATKWVVTVEGWIFPLGSALKAVTIPIF